MTGKNKIYLALIALGLMALAIDRTFMGATAPSAATADPVSPDEEDGAAAEAPPRPRVVPKPAGPSKLSIPELHFPRNLPEYDPALELRDIFARAEESDGVPGSDSSHPTISRKQAPQGAIGREAFEVAHRIDAVMVQESLKIAVVDGRWMQVGDVMDTCTLIRIEGDSAEFQCHDGDIVISPSGKRKTSPG